MSFQDTKPCAGTTFLGSALPLHRAARLEGQGFFLSLDVCLVGERRCLLYLMEHWFVTETILQE